jgi:hypothetical protein
MFSRFPIDFQSEHEIEAPHYIQGERHGNREIPTLRRATGEINGMDYPRSPGNPRDGIGRENRRSRGLSVGSSGGYGKSAQKDA